MDDAPYKSQQELLTEQFYEWERRGRGWQVWDESVQLEPPFRPFLYHWLPPAGQIDDGRRPSFIRSVIKKIRADFYVSENQDVDESDESEEVPTICDDSQNLIEFSIALPGSQSVGGNTTEQFLLGLKHSNYPMAMELIGLSDRIVLQMVCRESDNSRLKQQISAFFPEAVATQQNGFLREHWLARDCRASVVVDFGLSNEFMLPLQTFSNFNTDPLIAFVGALAGLEKGEVGILQILFQPTRHPWPASIIRSVSDGEGGCFFDEAPQILSSAEEKISRPLFAVVIRVGAASEDFERSWEIVRDLSGALSQFADPASNELIPLSNDDYPDELHEEDLLSRQTHRSGMILNSEELVSLVHFPSASVRSEKLVRDERRTKAAPAIAIGHRTVIGENRHNGKATQITLSPEQRTRHTYVIGASGTGKSTLLLNMIIQDINNGEGVGVLDPHGDLIDKVLGYIPESRHSDVILFDPSDEEFPIGFNILSAHSE